MISFMLFIVSIIHLVEGQVSATAVLENLRSLKGKTFRVAYGAQKLHLPASAKSCPGLFSHYELVDSSNDLLATSVNALAKIQLNHDCSGSFNGVRFRIDDNTIMLDSGLYILISQDKQMLRVDDDEPEPRAFLTNDQPPRRDWDDDTDGGYHMVMEGYECGSSEKSLGVFDTDGLCADAVLAQGGSFFSFGQNTRFGECYVEYTSSESCPEGWVNGDWNFYAMTLLSFELQEFIHKTMASKLRESGFFEHALEVEETLESLALRRQRRSLKEVLKAESELETGGRSNACGHSHHKNDCLDNFGRGVDLILALMGSDQTDVCKKAEDKRQKTHPNCCGGERAWYCAGLCCKGGGTPSCCGANWGWTIDPLFDNFCYPDQGSFDYIDGHDVCPNGYHSCSVWVGQRGGVCATNFGACMLEIFKKFVKMAEIVVNVVGMVVTLGAWEGVEMAEGAAKIATDAIETGAKAAAKAGSKSAARKAMMRAWKIGKIGWKDFQKVMKDQFKEIPEQLGDLMMEEAAAIMMANSAPDYSAEDLAWAAAEIVDPTGIVSLVNFFVNGQEWCVYPPVYSDSDQKELVTLTGMAPVMTRYSASYGGTQCGKISKPIDEITCRSLDVSLVEGRLLDYMGVGPQGGMNKCGCNFIEFEQAGAENMNDRSQIYFGEMNNHCDVHADVAPQHMTPICAVERLCDGKQYVRYESKKCGAEEILNHPDGVNVFDFCVTSCTEDGFCGGFRVEAGNCYITRGACLMTGASSMLYLKERCAQGRYMKEDGGVCPTNEVLSEWECSALDGLRIVSDVVFKLGSIIHTNQQTCGCFMVGDGDLKYNRHRGPECDNPVQGETPICRRPKSDCYDITPMDASFAGPYEETGMFDNRPFYCRSDGDYTIHYDRETTVWNICDSPSVPCRWNSSCTAETRVGWISDHGRFPSEGGFNVPVGTPASSLTKRACEQKATYSYDDYWATAPGALCPTAMHVIRTREECAHAIRHMSWNVQGDWNYHKNPQYPFENPDDPTLLPAGCSTAGGSAIPNFELSKWGRGKEGVTGVMQICKRPQYYMETFGGDVTCPNPASTIYDLDECVDAIRILGLTVYDADTTNGKPYGCAYDVGNTKAYFTPSQPEFGAGHTEDGRASICRKVNCHKTIGASTGHGEPFLTETVSTEGYAKECENLCLSENNCACFKADSSGTCDLFWYVECVNMDSVDADVVDQEKVFGMCPHAGALGFVPVKAAYCQCEQLTMFHSDGSMPGVDPPRIDLSEATCVKNLMQTRRREQGIDEGFLKSGFFSLYVNNIIDGVPQEDIDEAFPNAYGWFTHNMRYWENCFLTKAVDRDCSKCDNRGAPWPKYIQENWYEHTGNTQPGKDGGFVQTEKIIPHPSPGYLIGQREEWRFNQFVGGFFNDFIPHLNEFKGRCGPISHGAICSWESGFGREVAGSKTESTNSPERCAHEVRKQCQYVNYFYYRVSDSGCYCNDRPSCDDFWGDDLGRDTYITELCDLPAVKTIPSTGQCTENERLTPDQCEKVPRDEDNHSWGGYVDTTLGTCGCFVGQDGKRYYNDPIDRLEEKACEPSPGEMMICKENLEGYHLLQGQGLCSGPATDFNNGADLPEGYSFDGSVTGYRKGGIATLEACMDACTLLENCRTLSYQNTYCFLYESSECPQSSHGAAPKYESYSKIEWYFNSPVHYIEPDTERFGLSEEQTALLEASNLGQTGGLTTSPKVPKTQTLHATFPKKVQVKIEDDEESIVIELGPELEEAQLGNAGDAQLSWSVAGLTANPVAKILAAFGMVTTVVTLVHLVRRKPDYQPI